jgi:hypothetical protein
MKLPFYNTSVKHIARLEIIFLDQSSNNNMLFCKLVKFSTEGQNQKYVTRKNTYIVDRIIYQGK